MKKNLKKIILTAFTMAVMCIGIFTCREDVSAEEVWIVEGCSFDEATGALTITSGFDWTYIPWEYGDMDKNAIVTANIDTTGLNAGDLMYEDGWAYSAFVEMFKNCDNLVSVCLSGAVSPKGELDLTSMFQGCKNLKTVDLKGFSGAKISSMANMFDNCNNLQSVDLSGIDTSNTLYMGSMFSDCYSLQSLDVSHFDTSNVVNMRYMFSGCYSLQSLDVSHFDTSKVVTMTGMFCECKSIKSLNISNFNFDSIEEDVYVANILHYMESLESISVPANLPYALRVYCPGGKMNGTIPAGLPYPETYTSDETTTPDSGTQTNPGTQNHTQGNTSVSRPSGTSIKGKIKAKRKGFVLKWYKRTGIDGYQVQYSSKKNLKNSYYRLVSRKNTSMYFSNGIKAKKKYYVRIRTYKTVNGRKIYSNWSKKKSVITK